MKILSLFWCFILTIWNVNEYTACSLTKASNCFILTIWNVNDDGKS
ncbi:TPA: hypothetical protein RQB02_001431 [Clostridioides difficile]|nr:hypothetical protein [Clostridioides difficile]